jgi:hypothetical protein
MFLGLLASAPVWSGARSFPLLPVAPWFPGFVAPWDQVLFVVMLGALVVAGWFFRPAVGCFLVAGLVAFLQDQNRGQPWFYMYWVMLLLALFRGHVPLAACRLAMTAVYVWSGIQKCNERYFQVVPEWFAAPAVEWGWPAFLVQALRVAVMAAPFIEVAIGIAVWIPQARLWALGAAAALHAVALLILGPLGHNYNWVVWPWNLAMVALMYVLFTRNELWLPRRTPSGNPDPIAKPPAGHLSLGFLPNLTTLAGAKPALAVVTLYSLLPALSFSGRWDSDFSFALYSENQAVANLFITEGFRDRLPEPLRDYVHPFPAPYDPVRQGPLTFGFQAWCYEELHVPPFPEPRNYRSVFRHLRQWARQPDDLRMIIGTRGGPVIFLEGDREEHLQPSR